MRQALSRCRPGSEDPARARPPDSVTESAGRISSAAMLKSRKRYRAGKPLPRVLVIAVIYTMKPPRPRHEERKKVSHLRDKKEQDEAGGQRVFLFRGGEVYWRCIRPLPVVFGCITLAQPHVIFRSQLDLRFGVFCLTRITSYARIAVIELIRYLSLSLLTGYHSGYAFLDFYFTYLI
ncbi:hypothetical protein NDU88_010623 [Pleurodeles waltl]|uniref:Uncharacterized protein n=1 Tax=Pleurodeles waltl TaxID=8319 RepID=A0AAV7RYR1_PLEWA|nr:hypothetical protein NDU88_010623 [Pleurodeles waltl]